MISVLALTALSFAIAIYVTFNRKALAQRPALNDRRRGIVARLGLAFLYVPLLIIAARLGARTSPGIWMFGTTPLFADKTNGDVFYFAALAALVCGIIDVVMFFRPMLTGGVTGRMLVTGKYLLLAFAILIAVYAIVTAVALERLP